LAQNKKPADVVLRCFKKYAHRHGHSEVKLWESSDIAHMFYEELTPTTLKKYIVLRPLEHSARIWDPDQLYTITIAEARKNNLNKAGPFHLQFSPTCPTRVTEDMVYLEIIPKLEEAGICLTNNGSVDISKRESDILNDYNQQKQPRELFNLNEVIEAMSVIPSVLTVSHTPNSSYVLKHVVERASGTYKSNGVVILALLLLGHKARLRGDCSEGLLLNPMFLLTRKIEKAMNSS